VKPSAPPTLAESIKAEDLRVRRPTFRRADDRVLRNGRKYGLFSGCCNPFPWSFARVFVAGEAQTHVTTSFSTSIMSGYCNRATSFGLDTPSTSFTNNAPLVDRVNIRPCHRIYAVTRGTFAGARHLGAGTRPFYDRLRIDSWSQYTGTASLNSKRERLVRRASCGEVWGHAWRNGAGDSLRALSSDQSLKAGSAGDWKELYFALRRLRRLLDGPCSRRDHSGRGRGAIPWRVAATHQEDDHRQGHRGEVANPGKRSNAS